MCVRRGVSVCVQGGASVHTWACVCMCTGRCVCRGLCMDGGVCKYGCGEGWVCAYICVCAVSRDAGTAGVRIPLRERTGPCLSLCLGSSTGCPHVWVPLRVGAHGPPFPARWLMGALPSPSLPGDRWCTWGTGVGQGHGVQGVGHGVWQAEAGREAMPGGGGRSRVPFSPPSLIPPCPGAEAFCISQKPDSPRR